MMHEIAVGCINVTLPIRVGLTKFDHRKIKGWEKDRFLHEDLHRQDWVPARAVLALLL